MTLYYLKTVVDYLLNDDHTLGMSFLYLGIYIMLISVSSLSN